MAEKIIFDYIKLPEYFTLLLRSDMQSSSKMFIRLKSFIWDNKSFLSMVSRCFIDLDKDLKLEKIINSLGWLGFRDRLANEFINYEITNKFSTHKDLKNIDDILTFEKNLQSYCVEGFSRGFLFAFYLKMGFIGSTKKGLFRKFNLATINEDLLPLLKYANGRIVKIDLMILLLHHYYHYLGVENLSSHLEANSSFQDLYELIEEGQKKELVGNLLSYSSSIGEHDLFDALQI